MTHYRILPYIALISVLLLSACSTVEGWFGDEEAPPLEGERISVLELEKSLEPDDEVLETEGLVAPAPWENAFWPQEGGYPNHAMQNLALAEGPLEEIWSADIGQGSTEELPLTAQPIVVNGRIFTLDSEGMLSAFSIDNGAMLWQRDVSDPKEDDPVITGGIAFDSGVVYVTNGYRELVAVRPDSGEILWRRPIPVPARAAPTIMEGRVFVTTLDNRLVALDAGGGAMLWEHIGLSETAGLIGAASPAANKDIVVPVFSSGEIAALRVENGSVAWSDNLANLSRMGGLANISDIRALPVIDRGLVIAMSFGGRLSGIDMRTGARAWQRDIGGANTPWVAGNHVFVLTKENELVALGRDNGAIRWVTKLENEDPVYFSGPVLAGGRLILAGTGGIVLEAEPQTGKIIRQWDSGDTVNIAPVVAGGTLYLLSEDGTLSAYR